MAAQQKIVVINGKRHNYSLRRSRRAKHILLHVEIDGKIEVVVPWRVSFREADKFVSNKQDWLKKTLEKNGRLHAAVPRRSLVSGEFLPLLGENVSLQVVVDAERHRSRFRDEPGAVSIFVRDKQQVRPTLVRWYKKVAHEYFLGLARNQAARLGMRVQSVTVSDARSQWGSCIQKRRRISLQWRLLLGPKEVAAYVTAHEVAHLVERQHSQHFWRLVAWLDSDYEQHRQWLRKNGYTLVL
jgi:predicted metal-dependent hydrolase